MIVTWLKNKIVSLPRCCRYANKVWFSEVAYYFFNVGDLGAFPGRTSIYVGFMIAHYLNIFFVLIDNQARWTWNESELLTTKILIPAKQRFNRSDTDFSNILTVSRLNSCPMISRVVLKKSIRNPNGQRMKRQNHLPHAVDSLCEMRVN